MVTADYSHLDDGEVTWKDIVTSVSTLSITPLDAPAKSIFLTLLTYSSGPFGDPPLAGSAPGVQLIADCTGLSRSTVQRKLRVLVDSGWIRLTYQGGDGSTTNVYALPVLRHSGLIPFIGPYPSFVRHWAD